MNCDKALELLSGHMDAANTPEEEAQLQAHLASCPACRDILAAYEEADRGLAALHAEPPAELVTGIMDAIRQEASQPKKIRRFPTRGIAATAVAAALLIVIGAAYLPTLDRTENSTADMPDAVSYTADAPSEDSASLVKSVPTDEEAAEPAAASVEAPEEAAANSEATVSDGLSTEPSIMSVDAPSDAVQEAFPDGQEVPQLLVELVDNPSAPAASNITELSQLTAEETATDRIVYYACSAGTARDIVAGYETEYTFEIPAQLDTAADSDACGLLVIQP